MTEALQKKINFDHARNGGVNLLYAMAGNGRKEASHWVQHETSDAVTQMLRDFFKE